MAYFMNKENGTLNEYQEDYKRGDIYWIKRNPNRETIGSVIWQDRPAVIVSNDGINIGRSTVEVVYLTTSPRKDSPEHCTIRSTEKPSTVLCEQISTIDKSQLGKYLGTVTSQEQMTIDACLAMSLGMTETRVSRKSGAPEDLTITKEKDAEIEAMKMQLNEAEQKIAKLRKICIDLIGQ